MELMTRCPACSAVFAASLAQLQLRKGYVRCPHCAQIFDGYEAVVPSGLPAATPPATLVPMAPSAPLSAPPVLSAIPTHVMAPKAEDTDVPLSDPPWSSDPSPTPAAAPSIAPFRAVRRAAAEPSSAAPTLPPAWLRAETPRQADAVSVDADEPFFSSVHEAGAESDERAFFDDEPGFALRDDDEPEPVSPGAAVYGEARGGSRPVVPDFLVDDEPTPRSGWARVFWRVLVLAGVLLALGQAAYVYRMQLAVQWPWLRPVLEQVCQPLKCTVPQARSISSFSISDSSLQRQTEAAGSSGGQRMVFEALLRNTLDAPQQWPVMWLELTDMSGAVVSRRYLTPDVYLAPQPVGPAFAAASEQRIAVPLDIRAVHVSGYQVGLFFP